MAWNEPGNNNGNDGRDNDPWGNNNRGDQRPGGRDQGPLFFFFLSFFL